MKKRKLQRQIRNTKFTIRRNLFALYASLKHNKKIWATLNSKAQKDFSENKPTLNPLQERIVNDLNDSGIAITSLDELFPNQNLLDELHTYLEKRKDRSYPNKKKTFLVDLLPETPDLGLEVPFFRISINPTILDTVNSYMGMHSRILHFNVRETVVNNNRLPSHSQNWHRAPQEQKNCRVYIYLTDVDEKSGPFVYIPHSVTNKKYGDVLPHSPSTKGYVSAEVVESRVPESDIKTVTGSAGTVIFCDSTGLHRGGYSTETSRIMSTFGYGAPSYRENISYSYPEKLLDSLSGQTAAKAALNPKWSR